MPARQPRCEQCGYDLRGLETVKEPRCPECGLAFDPQTLGHWVLPWTKRHLIGKRKAYWKTVWMLLKNQKEIRADTMIPLAYDDARDFCRQSQWLVYLPVAIATGLFYCTVYAGIVHTYDWALRRVSAVPGTHSPPTLMDPAVVDWALPWLGLAGLLVLEWVGLKLMPFLTALTVHLVAANNLSQTQRQRELALCLYNQFPGQVVFSLFTLAPISVVFTLFLFQPGDNRVAPGFYAFPVLVAIGLAILFLCAISRHHMGIGVKTVISCAWAALLTASLILCGMLGLRMIVAAIWSSLL